VIVTVAARPIAKRKPSAAAAAAPARAPAQSPYPTGQAPISGSKMEPSKSKPDQTAYTALCASGDA
jgi:hypothetical protein